MSVIFLFVAVCCWFVGGTLSNVMNKVLLVSFESVAVLVWWQLAFGAAFAYFWQRLAGVSDGAQMKARIALGAMNFLSIFLTDGCFLFGELAFVSVFKATEPCFMLLVLYVVDNSFDGNEAILVLPVVLGLALTTVWSLSGEALFLGVLSNTSVVCLNVLVKRSFVDHHPSTIHLYMNLKPLFAWTLVVVVIGSISRTLATTFLSAEIIGAGALFAFYRLMSVVVVGQVSLVTHSLLNACKRAIVVFLSSFFLGKRLSVWGWGGVWLTFASMYLFAHRKSIPWYKSMVWSMLALLVGVLIGWSMAPLHDSSSTCRLSSKDVVRVEAVFDVSFPAFSVGDLSTFLGYIQRARQICPQVQIEVVPEVLNVFRKLGLEEGLRLSPVTLRKTATLPKIRVIIGTDVLDGRYTWGYLDTLGAEFFRHVNRGDITVLSFTGRFNSSFSRASELLCPVCAQERNHLSPRDFSTVQDVKMLLDEQCPKHRCRISEGGDAVSLLQPSAVVHNEGILADIRWLKQAEARGAVIVAFSDPMYYSPAMGSTDKILSHFVAEFKELQVQLNASLALLAVPHDFRKKYEHGRTPADFLKTFVTAISSSVASPHLSARLLAEGKPFHVTEAMVAYTHAKIALGGSMHFAMLCAQSGVPSYNFSFQAKHNFLSQELYGETLVIDQKDMLKKGVVSSFLAARLREHSKRKARMVEGVQKRALRVEQTAFMSIRV